MHVFSVSDIHQFGLEK